MQNGHVQNGHAQNGHAQNGRAQNRHAQNRHALNQYSQNQLVQNQHPQNWHLHNWHAPNAHSRSYASACAGSTLIEVMLAVALMAVTALGLIAGQLWTAREARAMSMREHAAWIADSVAEAMCSPSAGESAIRQWSARATAVLPHGEASVRDNGGVSAARVTWAALRDLPQSGELIDKPAPCGGADLPVGSSCVALAFAK